MKSYRINAVGCSLRPSSPRVRLWRQSSRAGGGSTTSHTFRRALLSWSIAAFLAVGLQPAAGGARPGRVPAPSQRGPSLERDSRPVPGAQLWLSRYNGSANRNDFAAALEVSPDGSKVFMTGSSAGSSGTYDYATVAYDTSTGGRIWVSRYNDAADKRDEATSLAVSPDGASVFVTGHSSGSGSSWDYATVAYHASSGDELWVRRYDGPADETDVPASVRVSPAGARVFVTGYSLGSRNRPDYATVAYDVSSGARLWVARYNGPGDDGDTASSLGVSADGSTVFVTGGSAGSATFSDYATVAYDASSGTKRWVARYNGPADDVDAASSLGVSPDGSRVFVTGESYGSTHTYDYATVAYDASSGTKRWVARYSGSADDTDRASSLGMSPDGSTIFVSGSCCGPESSADYGTVAYDASSGARLWVDRYNGPGSYFDGATSIGVAPDGAKVFVTGLSYGSTDTWDYATVAYDASSGAKLWATRYNGPADDTDIAISLRVSPNRAKVFVTGTSVGSAGTRDYATLAYRTG